MRFVALLGLLASCASANGIGNDANDRLADASLDAMPDAAIDARPIDAYVPDACVPVAETCDGLDNDCDGSVDEDFQLGTACDGPDTDACKEGVLQCDGVGGVTCSDTTTSTVEKCNGLDDDCQNGVDDTFAVGAPCSVGLGACARTGALECTPDGSGTQCNAVAGGVAREICGNGIDEDCDGADATCPPNDFPAGAIDISSGGTFAVDLTAAHDDNWHASSLPQFDCGNMGGRDAFYTFTLPAEEVVYFDSFGSDFDSVIRVYAGACTALGTLEACADDACHLTRSQGAVDLPAGQYCLVLDQFEDATVAGAGKLTFLRGGRPGTVIAAATGSVTGTNATGATDRSVASCEANSHQPDVGYAFLACPGTTTVDVNMCTGTSYDAVLSVRDGAATSADVACGDDECSLQPRITGAAIAGPSLGWFIVDGWGTGASGKGSYTLTYTFH